MPESDLPAKTISRSAVRRQRDQQVRRSIRKLRALAGHLDDQRYLPLLRSYCELSLLIERGYTELRDKPLVSTETGELRGSIDTLRRMMDTQRGIARELGLSPTVAASLAKPVKFLDLDQVRDDGE